MLSLGLWHNFGDITPVDTQQRLLRTAFDNGITYFDLANNYGPHTELLNETLDTIWIVTGIRIEMN